MPIDPGTFPKTILITAECDPFGDDPPYAPAFYEAIGRIMVMWGQFELFLNAHQLMVINIARRFGIEKEAMVSLTGKTRQIREIYKTCPLFQGDAQAISVLMTDIDGVGEDRNLVFQSHADRFVYGDPPRLNLRIMRYKKGGDVRRAGLSLAELGALAGHIDRLHNRLLPFFFKALPLQEGYETIGKGKVDPGCQALDT
jgi:hypothetical protein